MGVETAIALTAAAIVGGTAAAVDNHYDHKKEREQRKVNEHNERIKAQNELVEKRNARQERVSKIFNNTTDISTGNDVEGLFNQSNSKLQNTNRSGNGGLFNNSNTRLQPGNSTKLS
jgi:hypothetical protein